MKRVAILLGILLFGWLATGFYVVRGNEMGVVRRFGKVLRNSGGSVALRSGGLHFDLPWPLSQIDRVNLNEVHTLEVGTSELEDFSDNTFVRNVGAKTPLRYLTGDKNILNVKFGVQYRVADEQVDAYLFGTRSPAERLRVLAESILTDIVTRSGVEFVHTHGRPVIQEMLTDRLRRAALKLHVGVRVESVTLETVEPPLRVRAAFLKVIDERANKLKAITTANAYADQREISRDADAAQIANEAEVYRRQTIQQARARARSGDPLGYRRSLEPERP
ncbi:MAG: protease modulator HflK, partial [Planctomycetaceae bacterium]